MLIQIDPNNFTWFPNETTNDNKEIELLFQMNYIIESMKTYFNKTFSSNESEASFNIDQSSFSIIKSNKILIGDEEQLTILAELILFISVQHEYYLNEIEHMNQHPHGEEYKNIILDILNSKLKESQDMESEIDSENDEEDGNFIENEEGEDFDEEKESYNENDNDYKNGNRIELNKQNQSPTSTKRRQTNQNKSKKKQNQDENHENENTSFLTRIKYLEKENNILQTEILDLRSEILSIKNELQVVEDLQKDTDLKYQESQYIIDTYKRRESDYVNNSKYDNNTLLLMEISEYKGKIQQNENRIKRLMEEKEHVIGENKEKLYIKDKEIDRLKGIEQKYNNIIGKLEKEKIDISEIAKLRLKNINLETQIKQLEIKKDLKEDMNDKEVLLKKIEQLNYNLSEEKTKREELERDKSELIQKYITLEREFMRLNKEFESINKYRKEQVNGVSNESKSENDYASQYKNDDCYYSLEKVELEENNEKEKKNKDIQIKSLTGANLNLEIYIKKLEEEKNELQEKLSSLSNNQNKENISKIEGLKQKIIYLENEYRHNEERFEEEIQCLSSMIYSISENMFVEHSKEKEKPGKLRLNFE